MVLEHYLGESESLLIAFDIGTTLSAVTITHLQPRQIPTILTVNAWPEAETSSKIPTLLLYDASSNLISAGAEVRSGENVFQLGEGTVFEVECFKLLLHPSSMAPPPYDESQAFELPSLPPGVTIQRCYNDFLRYLFINARDWYYKSSPDAKVIWTKLISSAKFVIAFPNGWNLPQLEVLKSAFVSAEILNKVGLEDRLCFVSEGEASVHFGIEYAQRTVTQWLKPGSKIAVVDAGGSTVDINVYKVNQASPKIKLEEITRASCTQNGGIFVTKQFKRLIANKLINSKYYSPDFITDIGKIFDEKTKLKFDDEDSEYLIKFGQYRDNDRDAAIRRGHIVLLGKEVKSCFDVYVNNIIKSLEEQLKVVSVDFILLVGGFGESPYLARKLRETFGNSACALVSVNEPTKKAVAVGAALFSIKKNTVSARVARFTFGTSIGRYFNQDGHQAGKRQTYYWPDGCKLVYGGFSEIASIGSIYQNDQCVKISLLQLLTQEASLATTVKIYALAGPSDTLPNGKLWMEDEKGNQYPGFSKCLDILVNFKAMAVAKNLRRNVQTLESYWHIDYKMGIFFGATTITAKVFWEVDGVEYESNAAVLPSTFY